MTKDARYPVSFDASPLAAGAAELLEDPSLRLLVDFFQAKGLQALMETGTPLSGPFLAEARRWNRGCYEVCVVE